jgi:hypothetical protein
MSAGKMARELEQDQPQSPGDRQYIEACEAAGIQPDLARRREYPKVLVLPVVDRGRRVGDPPLREQYVEATHAADVVEEILEEEIECDRRRRAVLDAPLSLFVAESRTALEAGHRFAAVIMRTGEIGPAEMCAAWKDLTEARLKRARKQLEELLVQHGKGGAL